MRYFAVRNRADHNQFASPVGWAPFELCNVFTFHGDSPKLIEGFRNHLDQQTCEMVEITFKSLETLN